MFYSNETKISVIFRPYDTVGCWFGNKYVISSEFKWLSSQMISATMLWMNKVSFALEENFDNYMLAGMRTLFKLYGKSGNAPRQFIVANCCRDLTGKEPTGLLREGYKTFI